ncbi:MAG: glycosyltransferase family 2 protein [Microgenomates group bacterium]
MDKKITVLIQAYNEQEDIVECIKSARLLSHTIIVVDTESTDETAQLAKKNGVQVCSFPFARYVEPARNFGIEKVKTEWVFLLDVDERITEELAGEIAEILRFAQNDTGDSLGDPTHYKLRRKNIFAGKKWLQHGGWNSATDYQTRLIKKSAFKEWPQAIHSTPVVEGQTGLLKEPLLHYFHKNLETMVAKTAVYEDVESDLLFKAGKPVSTATFFRKFLGELYRRLFKWQGYRDGTFGVIESIYQAFSKTITYLFLYEKYHEKNSNR